jgi:hypothetical protein
MIIRIEDRSIYPYKQLSVICRKHKFIQILFYIIYGDDNDDSLLLKGKTFGL